MVLPPKSLAIEFNNEKEHARNNNPDISIPIFVSISLISLLSAVHELLEHLDRQSGREEH